MNYEEQVYKEAVKWSRSLEKRSGFLQRKSKGLQSAINKKIPDLVHQVVTESIKRMIELSLTGSQYILPIEQQGDWTFQQREELVREKLKQYKRSASWEGAGTGAGGFWLGAADFPLLLSIKMKFLFDAGQYYGLNVERYEERVFLLHIFMLAFSSEEERGRVKEILLNWDSVPKERKQIDWKSLQIEYRDTIDFVKMFQLLPGIGAVVGYVANGRLLEQLGETTMNVHRLRLLHSHFS
ncbi:EcsC family protein [Halobacillus sp. Marseille-Q1614]|uniref:EcsC family protein n=1 Tax=Halobacillus sp. Marseille-Q1614 TaxID=2709134 RepID=UPI00156DC455|nr:EcsC family protein [Halobacillus sp. Marseille-Q1614]